MLRCLTYFGGGFTVAFSVISFSSMVVAIYVKCWPKCRRNSNWWWNLGNVEIRFENGTPIITELKEEEKLEVEDIDHTNVNV